MACIAAHIELSYTTHQRTACPQWAGSYRISQDSASQTHPQDKGSSSAVVSSFHLTLVTVKLTKAY